MPDVTHSIRTTHNTVASPYSTSVSSAWVSVQCPHCGAPQMFIVASASAPRTVRWVRCAVCLSGAVIDHTGQINPGATPLREPKGMPDVDQAIWSEARACLSVGAYAATVMLCRKLLFHIAVANGLPAKDGNDRAPTFAAAVKHLESEGVVTKKMLPWVERIKDIGNDANHELTPITAEQANDVAGFTLQLLILAYEMDALMADPSSADEMLLGGSSVDH